MALSFVMRRKVLGLFEQLIHDLVTRRILLYHDRLVKDGFIPDLRPPYPARSLAGDRLPDSYGVNAWGTIVDGVDYTPSMIRRLIAENKVLRANPLRWHDGDTVRTLVAIPGTELIASSDAEIVGLVVWKDRLICATKQAMFERGDDGKFHELELVPVEPQKTFAWESTAKGFIAVDTARGPDKTAVVAYEDGKITEVKITEGAPPPPIPSEEDDPPMCRHGTETSQGWCVQCEVFGADDALKNPKVLCVPDDCGAALTCAYHPVCETNCRRYGYKMQIVAEPDDRGFGTDKGE